MSDPCVEAAQRAWTDEGWEPRHFGLCSESSLGIAAAREMAKSVQELIAEARTWKPYDTHDIGEAYPADTVDDFLHELSKRVYPSEELGL